MPVQPVLAERNHRVRPVGADGRHDLFEEHGLVGPPQVAVGMIEDHDLGNAQDARRLPQFVGAHAAEIAAGDERRIA